VVIEDPGSNRRELVVASDEAEHVRRIPPVLTPVGRRVLEWRERRRAWLVVSNQCARRQQTGQPGLVESGVGSGRLALYRRPERVRFFLLVSRHETVGFEEHSYQHLQRVRIRIIDAGFPILNRAPIGARARCKLALCQSSATPMQKEQVAKRSRCITGGLRRRHHKSPVLLAV
jgi:hypothetical protein